VIEGVGQAKPAQPSSGHAAAAPEKPNAAAAALGSRS